MSKKQWSQEPYWQKALFSANIFVGALAGLAIIRVAEARFGMGVPYLSSLLVLPLIVYVVITPMFTTHLTYKSFAEGEKKRMLTIVPLMIVFIALAMALSYLGENSYLISLDWAAAMH